MGIHHVLFRIDWPSVFCLLVHVLSSSSLPTLTKLLVSHLHFTYPTTLAFIHSATVVICMWFWTILNIFRPRSIPWRTLVPLALSAALNAVLQAYCISVASLLHFQMVRLLPLVLLAPNVQALPFLVGVLIVFVVHPPTPLTFFVMAATLAASFADRSGPLRRLRCATRATDLQLQLLVRSLSTVFIFPLMLLMDDFSSKSALPARLILDEPTSFFVYSTGMLSFFSFVALRVSYAKLHPYAFRAASLLSSIPVLVIHFVVYEAPRLLDAASLFLVLFGAYHITIVEMGVLGLDDDESSTDDSLSSLSDLESVFTPEFEIPRFAPMNGPNRLNRTSSSASSRSTTIHSSMEVTTISTVSHSLVIV